MTSQTGRGWMMFYFGGAGISIIVGALLGLSGHSSPEWAMFVAAFLVVAVAWRLWPYQVMVRPVTPNPEQQPGTPAPTRLTRRWVRMLYHNGLISIEELSAFYDRVPEDPNDPDPR